MAMYIVSTKEVPFLETDQVKGNSIYFVEKTYKLNNNLCVFM